MNPPKGQTPLDYLNDISPDAAKGLPFSWNLRTIIFAAIAAIILMVIIVNIVSAVANSQKDPWERLSARLATTSVIVDSASSNIKNSQLRSLNSDLKLYITNTNRDLAVPLGARGIKATKLPPKIVSSEANTAMIGRLEDGRLNAKFDSTYAREMSYQLATTLSLIQTLEAKGGSTATKTFLKEARENLEPTYKEIANFSASNE